jgi:hypothetical protein
MNFLKENYGLTVLAQCVTCRGENVHQNEVSVGAICLNRNDRLGLWPIAVRNLSVFSGVLIVLIVPSSFLFVAEAVVRNCCTQFLMMLRSGTVLCRPLLKCRLNIPCVAVIEQLFMKDVSTVNARRTADY